MRNREYNIESAKNTLKMNNLKYKDTILKSIKTSKIYDRDSKFERSNITEASDSSVDIKLVDMFTLDAVKKYRNGKTAVLNFASFKNPGGGFMRGSMAQEESLCHNTTLYNVLDNFWGTFYRDNLMYLHNGLYDNRAIYSPDIIYWRDEQDFAFDILTCAAPNLKGSTGVSQKENYVALKSRIEFVMNILENEGCETIILGAFGCGVFGQNPYDVARLFKSESSGREFKHITYAVPDKNSENYKAFKKII